MTSRNKLGRNALDIADSDTTGNLHAGTPRTNRDHGVFSAQTMMMSLPSG